VVLSPMPFTLGTDESTMVLATFFIPRGTMAGTHHVTYKIADKKKPSVTDFIVVPVKVLPAHHIVVEHLDSPQYVIAGDAYASTFSVMNQGNTTAQIEIFVYSMDDLPHTVLPIGNVRTFTLPPWTSQPIQITVKTEETMKDVLKHRVEVKAKVITGDAPVSPDDQLSDRAASKTDIIPRVSGIAGLYHMLPVLVGIKGESYFNDIFGAESKVSIKSEGSIDEEGYHNIKLRLEKAVSTTDDPRLHPEDYYFLRYWNPVFDILRRLYLLSLPTY